jgi:hypothetical protein
MAKIGKLLILAPGSAKAVLYNQGKMRLNAAVN